MTRPVARWRIPAGSELRWRSWDDEFVVYHCDSGHTHRLNAVAAEALRGLEGSLVTTDELVAAVAARLKVETDAAFLERVEDLLDDFEEWGLVERIDEAERDPATAAG